MLKYPIIPETYPHPTKIRLGLPMFAPKKMMHVYAHPNLRFPMPVEASFPAVSVALCFSPRHDLRQPLPEGLRLRGAGGRYFGLWGTVAVHLLVGQNDLPRVTRNGDVGRGHVY